MAAAARPPLSPEQVSGELERMYRAIVCHEVFADVADLHWNEHLTGTQMDKIRTAVSRWIAVGLQELSCEVSNMYGSTGADTLAFVQERLDPFRDLRRRSALAVVVGSHLNKIGGPKVRDLMSNLGV